jgi:hypothetical protein
MNGGGVLRRLPQLRDLWFVRNAPDAKSGIGQVARLCGSARSEIRKGRKPGFGLALFPHRERESPEAKRHPWA